MQFKSLKSNFLKQRCKKRLMVVIGSTFFNNLPNINCHLPPSVLPLHHDIVCKSAESVSLRDHPILSGCLLVLAGCCAPVGFFSGVPGTHINGGP